MLFRKLKQYSKFWAVKSACSELGYPVLSLNEVSDIYGSNAKRSEGSVPDSLASHLTFTS